MSMVLRGVAWSDELRAPRVVAFEGLVEVEHFEELVARVGGLAHEELQLDEREDDVADVGRAADPPMLEDHPGQDAEPLEREIAARQRELAARDVASLRQ